MELAMYSYKIAWFYSISVDFNIWEALEGGQVPGL